MSFWRQASVASRPRITHEGTSLQKKTKEPNPARWIEASSEVVVLLAMNGVDGGRNTEAKEWKWPGMAREGRETGRVGLRKGSSPRTETDGTSREKRWRVERRSQPRTTHDYHNRSTHCTATDQHLGDDHDCVVPDTHQTPKTHGKVTLVITCQPACFTNHRPNFCRFSA